MSLLYRITLRISLALFFLFTAWSFLFYYIMIDEINDETDDSLEDYSEYIITRALAGEKLPDRDNGTNNSYFLTDVSPEYAQNTPSVRYLDENVYIYSKRETEPSRVYKTIFKDRENHYYELTVMIPTIEKEDLKETILFWIVILYIILLLVIIIVNAILLRGSLRPLYTMLNWLDKLRLNKEIPPLHTQTDIIEFRKLSEALMRSARRNLEMYEQQSLFIGHASHELQTPIAIAQNRLEILADDPDLTESQLLQVSKTKQTLEKISKLNKTLLLLTKIDNNQFPENKDVGINEIVRSLSVDFKEAYSYLDITFELVENGNLNFQMNETLAVVLLSNLIKNAYIHNHSGGKILLTIDSQSLRISNTATTGALHPEYIFRRFYQETKKDGSIGLGLSLVDSICKRYGLSISYWYEESKHVFELK